MDDWNINVEEFADRNEYEQLPAGDYLVEIVSADSESDFDRVSKMPIPDTQVVNLGYVVIDGPMTGRQLRSRHMIKHPDETLQEIGRSTIKEVCRCFGVYHLSGSADLLGKQCSVRVECKPDKNGKVWANIKRWWSLESQAPPMKQSRLPMQAPAVNPSAPQQRPQAPGQPQMWQPGSAPRAPGGYNPQVRPQQPPPGSAPY